jgi:hypothetical protein
VEGHTVQCREGLLRFAIAKCIEGANHGKKSLRQSILPNCAHHDDSETDEERLDHALAMSLEVDDGNDSDEDRLRRPSQYQ